MTHQSHLGVLSPIILDHIQVQNTLTRLVTNVPNCPYSKIRKSQRRHVTLRYHSILVKLESRDGDETGTGMERRLGWNGDWTVTETGQKL